MLNSSSETSTRLGDTVSNVYHTGLAISFITDELYALSGYKFDWDCTYDMLYKLDKNTGQEILSLTLSPTVNASGEGEEFSLVTGELYAIRGGNRLMVIDIVNGTETEKFILCGINTTSLAAPHSTIVPEPVSTVLFITVGAELGLRILKGKS